MSETNTNDTRTMMAMRQQDFQKRLKPFLTNLQKLFDKYSVGLAIKWNTDGPVITPVDVKKYEIKQDKVAKPKS